MAKFLIQEITQIRDWIAKGGRVEWLSRAFAARHTRDEINEAWWATKRFDDDREACDHANDVLDYQLAGVPLINGDDDRHVCNGFAAFIPYRPQF